MHAVRNKLERVRSLLILRFETGSQVSDFRLESMYSTLSIGYYGSCVIPFRIDRYAKRLDRKTVNGSEGDGVESRLSRDVWHIEGLFVANISTRNI